jgi:hypothetical protein
MACNAGQGYEKTPVTRRPPRSLLAIAVRAAILLSATSSSAFAQAWVPPQGTGTVSLAVQRIDHTGHRTTDGTLFDNGKSLNLSVFVEAEYAITNRLVVSGALPYVFGKYTDPAPPPPFIPFLPVDQCRCWHSGVQDFDVAARYNLANGSFALTPSISAGVPSHDYAYEGEAVIGRDLKELRIAIDAGKRLDVITPRLSIDGRYAYAFVERVLDVPNNRSNATLGVSYQLHRRLTTRGLLSWQRTHGGLRIGSPPPSDLLPPGDVNTPERLVEHDRLLRDNSLHAGGSMAYQFPAFDVFASYMAFVAGTDTHAGRALSVGISWPFELHRDRRSP